MQIKQRNLQNTKNYAISMLQFSHDKDTNNVNVEKKLNGRYAYIEIHFNPWFMLFKKEKKLSY